jgi:cytochrome c biogenesis protein CcdA
MTAKKKFILAVGFAAALAAAALVLKRSDVGATLVWKISDGGKLLLPLVASAALIDSVNPCAFSILFLTIAFLFSIGQLRSGILKIGGAYIFGIFLTYLAIGLGILQALHFFNTPNFMGKVGAALLVLLGAIGLTNVFVPAFPIKFRIPHAAHKKIAVLMEKGSVPAAFALGGLVGLCEFPCTGGPYLMVLGLLHDQGTYLKGLGYLLLYNLIFVLPLAAILLVAGNEMVLAKVDGWRKEHSRAMRVWSSVAMIVLGVLIFAL